MGMNVGGSKGGPRSDINVTPLVDVVLVLLIIFLVAMPVLMRDLPIEVPEKSEEPPPPDLMPDQLVLEWKDDGRLLMNGAQIQRTELPAKVRAKLKRMSEKVVFVDFGDTVRYGDAISVMDVCRGAGAKTVALKMREEGGATPGAPAPETP